MPKNLQRLHELAADAGLMQIDHLTPQELLARGLIRSEIKKEGGKSHRAAYDARSDEFLYHEDGRLMLFKEWKIINSIGRKVHARRSDANSILKKQPGDGINCSAVDVRQWLDGKTTRYATPLPFDYPYRRISDTALKPRQHELAAAVQGQNSFLRACRSWLICDDEAMCRINKGMHQLEVMRRADFACCGDSAQFRARWCNEPETHLINFNMNNQHCDAGGAGLPPPIPPLAVKPYMFRELEQCDRPAFVPLPPPDGKAWRPGQRDVAAAVFARDTDMLAVLPTGLSGDALYLTTCLSRCAALCLHCNPAKR